MPNRVLNYLDLPEFDIENGAMTPDPGREGMTCYSTRELRYVAWNGGVWRPVGHSDSRRMYGLYNIGDTNYLATTSTGGEPGVTTGYGVATLFMLHKVPAGLANLTSRCVANANGWAQLFSGMNFYFR